MQIEIEELVKQSKIIEFELPYYYKQDLSDDDGETFLYGRLDEDKCTEIQVRYDDNETSYETSYEISKNSFFSIKNSGYTCYIKDKYKCNEVEFEDAKKRAQTFLILI
jgi:hypothetical protein